MPVYTYTCTHTLLATAFLPLSPFPTPHHTHTHNFQWAHSATFWKEKVRRIVPFSREQSRWQRDVLGRGPSQAYRTPERSDFGRCHPALFTLANTSPMKLLSTWTCPDWVCGKYKMDFKDLILKKKKKERKKGHIIFTLITCWSNSLDTSSKTYYDSIYLLLFTHNMATLKL